MVDVFDSAPHCSSTPKVLLKQAASLAQCQDKQLEVRFIDVHAGGRKEVMIAEYSLLRLPPLFVIMSTLTRSLSLDQKKMREHLANCFEEGETLPFPLSATPRRFGMEEGEEGAESNSVLPVSSALGLPRHLPWKFGPLQRMVLPKLCNHSTGRFHRHYVMCSAV